MAIWNLGSFADEILSLIPNVPDNVSGNLLNIVDRQRINVEDYTNFTIGSTAIIEKYQPVILNMAISKVLGTMQLTGADTNTVKLGPWNVKKGEGSNLSASLAFYSNEAKEELKILGFGTRMYKSNG